MRALPSREEEGEAKAAGARARKVSLSLEKQLKEFRKRSLANEKAREEAKK